MPRLLTVAASMLLASSACCCCCNPWTWFMDRMYDGRVDAVSAGAAWLERQPASNQAWGGVVSAEPTCFGAFFWTSTDGRGYWEITYDVDGVSRDGTAEVQVEERGGKWLVVGASLVGAAGVVAVGEHLEAESSGDWDD